MIGAETHRCNTVRGLGCRLVLVTDQGHHAWAIIGSSSTLEYLSLP